MEVKLHETKLKERVHSYGGLHNYYEVKEEVDYTGRWKITRTRYSNEPSLELEVFTLEDVEYKVYEDYKVTRSFLWNTWTEVQQRAIMKTKVRANVRWVSENKLTLTYRLEEINQCGSIYE